jgi:uncharacterized coiled-coil protein SlyX
MKGRCTVWDVVEVVREAYERGELLKTERAIIERLVERENCRHLKWGDEAERKTKERRAYELVRQAKLMGLIVKTPKGFIPRRNKHWDHILKAYRLILCGEKSTCSLIMEELRLEGYETLEKQLALVEKAIQHLATAKREHRREVERYAELISSLRHDEGLLKAEKEHIMAEVSALIKTEDGSLKPGLAEEVLKLLELKQPAESFMVALADDLPKVLFGIAKHTVLLGPLSREKCRSVLTWIPSCRIALEVYEPICSKIDVLDREAPSIASILQHLTQAVRGVVKLEDSISRLREKIRDQGSKIMQLINNSYIRFKEKGYLEGLCEDCMEGSVDEKLKVAIKEFIEKELKEKFYRLYDFPVIRNY